MEVEVTELALRYGANPHQAEARIARDGPLPFEVASGSPGYINFLDALNSWQLVRELAEATGLPAATSFKHVSPAGAAVGLVLSDVEREVFRVRAADLSPLACAYARARGADRMSAFGDWIALSERLDLATALLIRPEVSDGLIAPGADADALQVMRAKQGGSYKVLLVDPAYRPPSVERREVFGLTLQQQRNEQPIDASLLASVPTRAAEIGEAARRDLLLAMIVLKYTQSNSVAIAHGGQALGIGCGQQSRIHCVQLAVEKATAWALRFHPRVRNVRFRRGVKRHDKDTWVMQFVGGVRVTDDGWLRGLVDEMPAPLDEQARTECLARVQGASMASDGFFPHRDSIDLAAGLGVRFVAQPGGSIQDEGVVAGCDQHGIAMAMTGLRLFHH